MTAEEVKNRLDELIKDRESFMVGDYDKDIYDRDKEALEFAVKAVEKQIPKKPNTYTIEDDHSDCLYKDKACFCPTCNLYFGIIDANEYYKNSFCRMCGQVLDWSGEDEENTDAV